MTNAAVDAGKSRGQTGLVNRETLMARRVVAARSPTSERASATKLSRTRGATEKQLMRLRSRMAACWTLLIPVCAGMLLVSVIPACGESGQASLSPYRDLVKVMFRFV
jgi:hypothetical protein